MSDGIAAGEGSPFEEQRQMFDLLSQETRHLVLQHILGHPAHLPSLGELAYMMPKNKAAIRDQLQVLIDKDVIQRYEYPPNERSRDLPSQFYGLTAYGVEVLYEYNYLRGLPIARALYDNTRLSEKVERHRDAPRPPLPEPVEKALSFDQNDTATFDRLEREIRSENGDTRSVDDQLEVVKELHRAGIGPDHDGLKWAELLEQIDVDIEHQPRTVLRHLADSDILEETAPPGPDVFAISERMDEIVNGRVTAEAEENIDALIAHIDDELQSLELENEAAEMDGPQTHVSGPSVAMADGAGRTVRRILADEFGIDPEQVTDYLRAGDPVDRLNSAIDAIESAEEVSKSADYGRIVFVHPAYRYRLTEKAISLL